MSRFYSDAYKWSLYEKYRNGYTLTELCVITGITDKPLREWFRALDAKCAQAHMIGLETARLETIRLKKQIEEKKAELNIFQSEAVVGKIPEILRISCACPLLDRYGPNQVCRSLKIRKSNLFYHTLRKPEVTAYEKHNQKLRPVIQRICAANSGRIGTDKIRQQLIAQGLSASKRKVLEILREFSPRKKSSPSKANFSTEYPTDPTNILARQFSTPRPNMVWLSDITMIKTDSVKFYLCVVLDLFARRVVAARLSVTEDADFVCRTFLNAFHTRGKPEGIIFHSDQGRQYTSHQFQDLLSSYKVQQSFSAPGVPYDNAPMESFFASLKTEEIYRFRYYGIVDLADSLREYLDFYNNKRPHSSINNLTPVQAEELYYNKQSAVEHPTDCVPFA